MKKILLTIKFYQMSCLGLLLSIYGMVSAEIVFDGSLGRNDSLSGPNFQINPSDGKQVGSNLFHSFSTFNINSGQTATFSGGSAANTIVNVIARVTGGQPSFIDGELSSDTPAANLFFLNPAGVMFGSNASLDIPGSFHVSTSDYIRLAGGGRFDVSLSSGDSLLSTGQPEAFGFLSKNQPIGVIDFKNSILTNIDKFTVTAGNISLTESSELQADGGVLSLVSVASMGEIKLIESNKLDISTFSKMGHITLGDEPDSGIISGNQVVIRGGKLELKNIIKSINSADNKVNNSAIDIQIKNDFTMAGSKAEMRVTGEGQNISINAGTLILSNGAEIINRNNNNDDDANKNTTDIFAKGIVVDSSRGISGVKLSRILAIGNSDVNITTDKLFLTDGGVIKNQGGDILISAISVSLDGVEGNLRAEIFASPPIGEGDTGTLTLNTEYLNILNGARISTSTSTSSLSSGNSGELIVSGRQIIIDGKGGRGGRFESSIRSEAQGRTLESGNGGRLSIIDTDKLIVRNEAIISARTIGLGNAGEIEIEANTIELLNQGKISSESSRANAGKAGTISINANDSLLLSGNSEITVATEQADAGSIDINADLLHLKEQSSITTSVAGGEGSGGNIEINPKLLILNDASNIIANAQQGTAGNIDIQIKDGGTLFRSFDSVIEASSQLGIDGNVEINAPDVDITSGFKSLPDTYLDVATILQKPCVRRFQGNAIQFVNQKYQVLPDSPYALRTVSYIQSDETRLNQSTSSSEEPILISKDQSHIRDCL